MTFYHQLQAYKNFDYPTYFSQLSDSQITKILSKDTISPLEYLALLSPQAENHLEQMAQKAHRLTIQNFGKVIFLFAPLYLANFCVNQCVYCSFNTTNTITRKQLALEEVEKEAQIIANSGIRHILILTGESRAKSSIEYLKSCVGILKKYFTSIGIEIYPLTQEEYSDLISAGVDSLTLFQEVYNEKAYAELHLRGPKKDHRFRLDAPERACQAKMRSVNIGALLGLDDWRSEAFTTGLHAAYLQDNYIDTEISVSLPRIRPNAGDFSPKIDVTDKNLVQIMLALRLFLPRAGITISTREQADLRDNLMKLGVTKMSAGVSTEVGGYSGEAASDGQFDISDERSVAEMKQAIYSNGYQPVFKDWETIW